MTSPRTFAVYVARAAVDTNYRIGRSQNIWGWKDGFNAVYRRAGEAQAAAMAPGDRLVLGMGGPTPRAPAGGWGDARLDRVSVFSVRRGLYRDARRVWPDDLYPNRVDLVHLEDLDLPDPAAVGADVLEALRLSANGRGAAVPVDTRASRGAQRPPQAPPPRSATPARTTPQIAASQSATPVTTTSQPVSPVQVPGGHAGRPRHEPGHLFVVRGDLKRLACDALLLPCDEGLNVSDVWAELLPPRLPTVPGTTWLHLPGEVDAHGLVRLGSSMGRSVAAYTAVHEATPEVEAVVRRTESAISSLASPTSNGRLTARDGRHLPLVALPLAGTGQGGLSHRRGEVVERLLPALRRVAAEAGVDVALVLHDRRDFAAVQARRDSEDWKGLTAGALKVADDMGRRAANGQLSLFLGAGVSLPVGLPDWWTLLEQVAAEHPAAPPVDRRDGEQLAVASRLLQVMGADFEQAVLRRLATTLHGLGHALLAATGVRQMVTTNFDTCMETALEAVLAPESPRVLTRNLADASGTWLLKLHGDVRQEGSVVLTSEHYAQHKDEYAALHGVVQSLMLTSHLLMVGFSLSDKDFLDMAKAVSRVRRDAQDRTEKAGTALALRPGEVNLAGLTDDLDVVEMTDDRAAAVAPAARQLEIFLDRLAWSAATARDNRAEFLLDDRYASGLTPEDQALRETLQQLTSSTSAAAHRSAAWPVLREALERLGADPRQLDHREAVARAEVG